MGLLGSSPRLRSWSSWEATSWISDSSLKSKSSQTAQSSRRTSISLNKKVSSITSSVSQDGSCGSGAGQSNQAMTGSNILTVMGSNLGVVSLSTRARMGQTSDEGSVWVSDTATSCIMSQGSMISRTTIFTIGSRFGNTVSQTFSYNRPVLFTPRFFRYSFYRLISLHIPI